MLCKGAIMEAVYQWGLDIIRVIQTIENPVLSVLMHAITELGSKYAYLVLLPLVYWCYNEKKGFRLAVLVLLSGWINSWVKGLLAQPRPYDLDPSVGRAFESSYGIPSGHSQGSLVFWAVIGSWIRKRLGLLVAIGIPLLIAFTRLYLGVHFPTDILAGWLLAIMLLIVYFKFTKVIESALGSINIRFRILAAAALTFIMNALHPEDTSLGGVFFGMSIGYILMTERFPFSAAHAADGSRPRIPVLILRYITGLSGAGLIYGGLKLILPDSESAWYELGRFVRYGMVGMWVSAAAPWIFLKLRLAGSRDVQESPVKD